jgi:hypothetical protein
LLPFLGRMLNFLSANGHLMPNDLLRLYFSLFYIEIIQQSKNVLFESQVVLLPDTKEDLLRTYSPVSKHFFQTRHLLFVSNNYSLLKVTLHVGISG